MKSLLFQRNDATREDSFKRGVFEKDLQVLLALPEKQLRRLPELMKAIIPIKNLKEKDDARDAAAKELALSKADFEHAYSVAGFFGEQYMPGGDAENDAPEAIAQDLTELGLCPREAQPRLTLLLTGIREMIQKDLATYILNEKAIRKGGVRLLQVSSSVQFRAVFEKEATFGDTSEEYHPKCIGFAPVATLHLTLRGENTMSLHLNVTPRPCKCSTRQ